MNSIGKVSRGVDFSWFIWDGLIQNKEKMQFSW